MSNYFSLGDKLPDMEKTDRFLVPPKQGKFEVEIGETILESATHTGSWLSGRGWAVCEQPIDSVLIYLNEKYLCKGIAYVTSLELGHRGSGSVGLRRRDFIFATRIPAEQIGWCNLKVRIEIEEEYCEKEVGIYVVGEMQGFGEAESSVDSSPKMATPRLRLSAILLECESASVNARCILRVEGWIVSLAPLEEVAIFYGSRRLGLAETGISRDDVGRVHPDYPHAGRGGFLFIGEVLDLEISLGTEPIRVVARARGGILREASLSLAISPQLKHNKSLPNAIVHFYCDSVALTKAGALTIDGWAICPSGLAGVEIDLDGEVLGPAEIGFDRPDVGNLHPGLPGSRTSGFRFSHPLGRPVTGEHIIGLTVRGRDGEERVVLQPVQVTDAVLAPPEVARVVEAPPFRFFLDAPAIENGRAVSAVRGFLSLAGWAVALAGVEAVDVFIDGVRIGPAYYGIRREDIQAAFPAEPGALRCGFALVVPPHRLKPGPHEVGVVVRDKTGRTAENTFTIKAEPRLEEDGPWRLRQNVPFAEVILNRAIVDAAPAAPALSLLIRDGLPGARTDTRLARTLRSLDRQVWDNWRAVLLTSPAQAAAREAFLVARYPHLADRLSVVATRDGTAPLAAFASEGDVSFVAILAAGDELGVDAVMEFAVEAVLHPAAALFYSDERRRDPTDGVLKAFFKPDWSPDLLSGTNYIGRIWAVRHGLLAQSGATVSGLFIDGEYNLVLRLTELTSAIHHVARVLCERGARDIDDATRERRALERAAQRRGRMGAIAPGPVRGTWRLKRAATNTPLVSIIIPTMAARDLIRLTIESIREKTTYRNLEIICLDNIPAANSGAKAWLNENSDAVVKLDAAFNWSSFNNAAVARAQGEFLLFLNDDIEVTDPAWLDVLVEAVERPEIGVVGPQLLYPDGKVQHAGMFLADGIARHAFRFAPRDEPGPFGLALTQREVTSVTGACMMVRRAVFDELGQFDVRHGVVNNDVDFCLRAGRAGYRVIYTPNTTLIHHEMASREHIRDDFHKGQFDRDWGALFAKGDPFFHPRLARTADDYLIDAEPTEVLHVGHPLFDGERVQRILVVKVDHIGDFLTAIPAIRLLKARFADAELSVLCARASLSIARSMPEVAEAIEFNVFHARSEKGNRKITRAEWGELRRLLGTRRFDLAIDLRLQPDTRPILGYSGANLLAGFAHRAVSQKLDIALEWEGDSPRVRKRTHVVDRLSELVEAVASAGRFDLPSLRPNQFPSLSSAVAAHLENFRKSEGTEVPRKLICIHPGVGNAARQWPAANFATLIDMFAEFDGAAAFLIGSPDEAAVAARVMRSIRHVTHVTSLVGRTSLADLPAVLLNCDLYIGNNSGPHHLAAALGVPTLGVHSGVVDAAEWGPFGPSGAAIRRRMTCSPCYISKRSDCPRNMTCIDDLKPSAVYEAAKRLLAIPKLIC